MLEELPKNIRVPLTKAALKMFHTPQTSAHLAHKTPTEPLHHGTGAGISTGRPRPLVVRPVVAACFPPRQPSGYVADASGVQNFPLDPGPAFDKFLSYI